MSVPQEAIDAHDAYWRVKETGDPPPFSELPVKLQQCWAAAAAVVAAAERERIRHLVSKWERDRTDRRNLRDSMATEGNRSYQEGYADALDGCVYELAALLEPQP